MLDLEKILEEWKTDCEIPQHQLDETSRNTPSLHAKYLQYLSLAKLNLKRVENRQKLLLKEKYMYYEGKMSKEEIDERGWKYDPFDGHNVTTKQFKEHYYETDKEIQASEEKILYINTVIDTLKEIVDTLRWRHQTIKNIIEFRKFDAGV